MRVVAGTYRRLRLKTLKGPTLRPTSDQMRETLFDVLGARVRESAFLDAYAGSGAVGIEALSRGAGQVVFLERHKPAAEMIRENLQALGVVSGFRILASDVEKGIERLGQEGTQFHFIFLDPPYSEIGEYHRILRNLGRSQLLTTQTWVIAEHSRYTRLEESYGTLSLARLIRHGDSQLAFYRVGGEQSEIGSRQ